MKVRLLDPAIPQRDFAAQGGTEIVHDSALDLRLGNVRIEDLAAEETRRPCSYSPSSWILAGAVYALIALAFVVVYKVSRIINFALGEWVMFSSRLTAAGVHGAGLGTVGALAFAGVAMVAFALAFNRVELRRLVGHSW